MNLPKPSHMSAEYNSINKLKTQKFTRQIRDNLNFRIRVKKYGILVYFVDRKLIGLQVYLHAFIKCLAVSFSSH